MSPTPIKNFISAFSRLPGLGPRAATRLAFYVADLDRQSLENLVESLSRMRGLSRCSKCFSVKEEHRMLCVICGEKDREPIVAIVEKETDLMTIEKSGAFKGTYFLIGEIPEDGAPETAQKLRLQRLKKRISDDGVKELLFALTPSISADLFYDAVIKDFNGMVEKISRLGRGIPTGGEVEFADPETIRSAIGRRV